MTNPNTLIHTPFAADGDKSIIQDASGSSPNSATWKDGFPQITQEPISSGGIPPKRVDFNGVLNVITENIAHQSKGLTYEFDAAYAEKIDGYPLNARLMLSDGSIVQNGVAGNKADPNVDMTGWEKGTRASDVQVGDSTLDVFTEKTEFSLENKGLNIWDFFTKEEILAYQADRENYDMSTAIQRGIGVAALLNRKINGYGEFYIANKTIIINTACDLLDAQLNSDVIDGIAVDVRNTDYSYIWHKELKLPRVKYKNHVARDGWIDNSIGVRIVNILSCEVKVLHIQNFNINLQITSTLSTCYNNFYIGQLDNGKINLDVTTSPLTETARPWTNENNFFGGRYSHNGGEGTNVAGVRHIRLYAETSTLNNSVFYKPSIEASVSEYNLELACQYCKFIQPRFESDPPRILYRKNNALSIGDAQAQYNVIDGGYNSDRIVFTKQGTGAFRNRLIAPNRDLNTLSATSGGNRYVNLSGRTHAVLSVFQPEVDIDTADFSQYSLALSSAGLRGKRSTDTSDRIFIDLYNGAIAFTDGTGSTPVSIARNAVGLNINGVLHSTTAGTDLGTNNYRFGRLLLSGGIGCYGSTPPVAKPSITGRKIPATIAEQNAVMDSIVSALVSLGLASDNRT